MIKKRIVILLMYFFCGVGLIVAQVTQLNSKEKKQGWKLLFDGISTKGWMSSDGSAFPQKGWVINNGELTTKPEQGIHGTDIITDGEYSDFELRVDFKTTEGANSGIKYFFTKYEKGGLLGLEYQIIDDERHPDAKLGRNGNRKCAALYDMFPAGNDKKVNPPGEWNTALIVSKGMHVEHWLNGKKVLDFDRLSPSYMEAFQASKYRESVPVFGSVKKGHILLQFHGDVVSFRNIRIKAI